MLTASLRQPSTLASSLGLMAVSYQALLGEILFMVYRINLLGHRQA